MIPDMDSESHSHTERLHAYWRMPYIKANSKKTIPQILL